MGFTQYAQQQIYGLPASYLEITCHWIEPETLVRKSAVLACERIRGRHTYDVIATKISQIHVYTYRHGN